MSRAAGVLVVMPALLLLPALLSPTVHCQNQQIDALSVEESLRAVHAVSSGARGALCVTSAWLALPLRLDTRRYGPARRQARLAAALLKPLGPEPKQEVLEAMTRALSRTVPGARGARALVLAGTGTSPARESGTSTAVPGPLRSVTVLRSAAEPPGEVVADPQAPWWEVPIPGNYSSGDIWGTEEPWDLDDGAGSWSSPYYSCAAERWLMSYTIRVPTKTSNGEIAMISLDIDMSGLELNQCEEPLQSSDTEPGPLDLFRGTHKCSNMTTKCWPRAGHGWSRGAYVCRCREGFYSPTHPQGFNGTLVEVAWQERGADALLGSPRETSDGWSALRCLPCAPGCATCKGPQPCRASYNWPFRSVLLGISAWCAGGTALLAGFLHRHRRARVFRSASPVFLAITLLGCATMYLEMAAIFPVLDTYSCIATKWCRHLGFCITYTALLMKTWRVSLTYRVKSAHAVKLTERQLLRWLLPVLLVALVFLGTWTLSDPPHAEDITDREGLKFKQCTYNWWDHSLALGELAFLLWGVRVCYGVRHAESLYNEARLISYAIYNIAAVNCLMLTFHLLIFPRVGPDMKYFLGFVRTQLSTSVTVALVFGPKVVRVCRGFGDQWDSRAARGVSASFSLNGIGSVHPHPPPTPHDLAQENDELKEEVQKLAAQIEFMKIVQMELHNRHLKPRPGGHFTMPPPPAQQFQNHGHDEIEKELSSGMRGG